MLHSFEPTTNSENYFADLLQRYTVYNFMVDLRCGSEELPMVGDALLQQGKVEV
jgi:hypothetical protein